MEYLLKIISMYGGNKSALASKLAEIKQDNKISPSHLNNWLSRDKKIPGEWVRPLSEAANWGITPHELRPDIYPHPNDGLPEHLRAAA